MSERTPRRFPPWLGIGIRMGLAAGLLGLAIRSNREPIADVLQRRPDWLLFAAAMGLYLCGLMLSYARWLILVRAVRIPFRWRDAFRLGFIGALFNFVIPGAVAGVCPGAASRAAGPAEWAVASEWCYLGGRPGADRRAAHRSRPSLSGHCKCRPRKSYVLLITQATALARATVNNESP